MKRKISLLLVLALMLTLVPMSAFAASSNGVVAVPKVSDSKVFTNSDAPELRIEEENVNEFKDGSSFTLTVSNGDWEDSVSQTVYAQDGDGAVVGTPTSGPYFEMVKRSNKEVEVTFHREGVTNTKLSVKLPMTIDVDQEGVVEVEVDGESSGVSSGKYVVANAADGDTITTINDTTDIIDEGAVIETIKLEETSMGAMADDEAQKIELRLPSDFKWEIPAGASVELSGGFSGTLTPVIRAGADNYIDITVAANALDSTNGRGKIYIKGLKVVPDSDADFGEVKVKVTGDNVSTATIVVGEYQDYGVAIKADSDDDMAELIAGRFVDVDATTVADATDDTDYDSEDHELMTLQLEENAKGAWLTQRKTRIEFPTWVKIVDITVDKADGFVNTKDDIRTALLSAIDDDDYNFLEFSGSNFELNGKAKLHLTFEVSVKGDATGDIVAEVSGRSLPNEGKVVLGKALAPVTLETKPVDVKLGYQDQELGTIILTETKAEALKDNKVVEIELASDFEWDDAPTVKVTKGDLEINEDSIDTDGRYLTFKIKGESSEASEITITGGTVDLDRTLPEGDFNVDVQGSAIVQNNDPDDGAYGFDKNKCASDVFARVITPADDNTKAGAEVKFVIGQSEYKVGEEVKTADVAPYIADGRTMLSLRFTAEAMGVTSENIIWDGATRTVTIFKGDRIAQVEIGSNKLFVNGVVVPMDTVAVIKDGRTMLPIRFIAQALGAEVEWDGATRTVTVK
ncbi:copper amine oxidase N-terminal domain-containing protein [Crassaminicella profunda]|uniref:copper amine oxidase N-terminal domain-containing protein n=1 Tax=Crassaminicella profunda TaxID=1286698 RepID=UPI001CA77BBE|nr:copper amine oxidase N-terminal domain-containing protein [Crassaminicella profunda]QZY55490.1 copper amine oxidase N-terminal domain-containing protein [Crassaminicella profunda]